MRMQSRRSLPLSPTTTTFGLGMERKSPALGIINGHLKSYTNVRMSRTGTRIGGETPLPWIAAICCLYRASQHAADPSKSRRSTTHHGSRLAKTNWKRPSGMLFETYKITYNYF
jgi:hypothetical protein